LHSLEIVAAQIVDRGTLHCFGVPGGGPSLQLIDQIERRGGVFHLVHFEGSAAVMAGVVGRLTGHAGVAISIKGPGLANMLPGLALSRFERFPVVAISEAFSPVDRTRRAHKRIDHDALVAGVAKGSRFLSSSGPGYAEMASWAEREPPAPVLLNLAEPWPEQQSEIPEDHPVVSTSLSLPSSRRPVVIAGTCAVRWGWSSLLNELRIPVFSTAAAKGIVDETLPNSAGIFTGAGLDKAPETSLIPRADLVIGIGLRMEEILDSPKFGCSIVNIDSSAELGGTSGPVLDRSTGRKYLEQFHDVEWGLDEIAQARRRLRTHLLNGGFLPAHVYDGLSERFRGDARLVVDVGDFCTVGEHLWMSLTADRYLSPGNSRYMGTAIPMAIAASVLDRSIPTIVVVGDGGIGPAISEVKLAVKARAPLLIILMSDGGFGSIRPRAIARGLSTRCLEIASPSWSATLEALGVPATPVSNENQLDDAISRGQQRLQNGPYFIEARFDRDRYEAMTRELRK
jgi:acetolactate synthase-1/2/3 large subunit